MIPYKVKDNWTRFWMRFGGRKRIGRLCTRIALWTAPPFKARKFLRYCNPLGFISPQATLYHDDIRFGKHVFIGDNVMIFQSEPSGPVEIGDEANLWGDSLLEVGRGGSITIGPHSRINRGVQLLSYLQPIIIGRDVGISTQSIIYSYNHSFLPGKSYHDQPLKSRGPVIIEDYVWVGAGVVILDGVRIGHHSVVAAGAVVTRDIPPNVVAGGVPARVLSTLEEMAAKSGAMVEQH
jgi:acetyltransferase-like isoleucine patch superfamily enzyme